MTPERFRQLLLAMNWRVNDFAAARGIDPRRVRRMLQGSADIPETLADWLEDVARPMLAKPQPDGWRTDTDLIAEREIKLATLMTVSD